jgi:hypothetical protein
MVMPQMTASDIDDSVSSIASQHMKGLFRLHADGNGGHGTFFPIPLQHPPGLTNESKRSLFDGVISLMNQYPNIVKHETLAVVYSSLPIL